MIRAMAMLLALLCAAGPTNLAAAWLVSCCELDCNSPCEAIAPAAPASCGCEGATVLSGEQVAPQTRPAAEPVSPLPAETPAAESSAPLAPVPVAPVAKPALPPATPATETQPPATQPAATSPAELPTKPANKPVTPVVEPEPSTPRGVTPADEPAAPAKQPAEQPASQEQPTTPVEDIFGESSAPAASERPASDAAPAEDAAPTTETPPEGPAAETAPAEQPAEHPPAEAPKAEELFDFGMAPSPHSEPGGWASGETRTWNDASGRHACQARLNGVTAKEVVLMRIDGDTVRIPYRLLSVDDLRFVRRQIEIRRAQLAQTRETIVASQSP